MSAYAAVGKLVGTGAVGNAQQGTSVKLSEDGDFLFVGGEKDSNIGAVWFYQKINGVWTQQQKIVPTGSSGTPNFGRSIAVNPSMNMLIVGAYDDNASTGAAFVFTFDGTTWTQQEKLVGNGATGPIASIQGWAVALSADANTAIVGGPYDGNYVGAAWIFVRAGNAWSQQGSKLVGTGHVGAQILQGIAMALTIDGNLAVVGGYGDQNSIGAIWVFLRSGTSWNQVATKITATGEIGAGRFGVSLALSGDDQTLVVGGYSDDSGAGATWTFKRNGNTFTQFGNKLVATEATSTTFGFSVAVNKLGTLVAVGNLAGVFVHAFNGTNYNQLGNKIVPVDGGGANLGQSVSLDGSGSQLLFGGPSDNGSQGAAWIYVYATSAPTAQPTIEPTRQPSIEPTTQPSVNPTTKPSLEPTTQPSVGPTSQPSVGPTTKPSMLPTTQPSVGPTSQPSFVPTTQPSLVPTTQPSVVPTTQPSVGPTTQPSVGPTSQPSFVPTTQPTLGPTGRPSLKPTANAVSSQGSTLEVSTIIIIAVVIGAALFAVLAYFFYRYRANNQYSTKKVAEMSQWINDSKNTHAADIQIQDKEIKQENSLTMTDIYGDDDNHGSTY